MVMGTRATDGSYSPPGNQLPGEVYEQLQAMCDAGQLTVTRMWCSEIGYYDQDGSNLYAGHFHGAGAIHLPVTFAVTPDPGEGVECERPPPVTFQIPLKKAP